MNPETWDLSRLSSAAVQMATLLVAAEWIKTDDGDEWCLWCLGRRPSGHKPECPLETTLKQAGVRP
jgi:hypothetical protein